MRSDPRIDLCFLDAQWAQLVLTIERSCSPEQRFNYQGVYAIGADDKRDLMVIKRATKSKAAQRKGAISNWKVNIETNTDEEEEVVLKVKKTESNHKRKRSVGLQVFMIADP